MTQEETQRDAVAKTVAYVRRYWTVRREDFEEWTEFLDAITVDEVQKPLRPRLETHYRDR